MAGTLTWPEVIILKVLLISSFMSKIIDKTQQKTWTLIERNQERGASRYFVLGCVWPQNTTKNAEKEIEDFQNNHFWTKLKHTVPQQTHTQRALPPMGVSSSSSQSPPRVHHIHIQRENLNCEISGIDGECEVRSESNSKLKIVVNEEAATVEAKATIQGQFTFM